MFLRFIRFFSHDKKITNLCAFLFIMEILQPIGMEIDEGFFFC